MERNEDAGECPLERIEEKYSGDTQDETRDRIWEDELPDSIKDLMRRLDTNSNTGDVGMSVSETDRRFPSFSGIYWITGNDFFKKKCGENPKRTEVRLKVLKALGSSQTLKYLNLPNQLHLKWSVLEWTALLVPLQTIATQLKWVTINCPFSGEEQDQVSSLWNKILRDAHNLKRLEFCWIEGKEKICPKLATEVASALRANSQHQLTSLHLSLRNADAGVGVHAAEIISCVPNLASLILGYGCPLDAVTREAWSGTLKRCRNLRRIIIQRYPKHGMWSEMWEVLADAYTQSSVNPVLEHLEISDLGRRDDDDGLLKFPDVRGGIGVRTVAALGRLISGNVRYIHLDVTTSKEFASTVLEHNLWSEGFCQNLHAPSLQRFRMNFDLEMMEDELLEKLHIFLAYLWKANKNNRWLDIQFAIHLKSRGVEKNLSAFIEKALGETYLKRISGRFQGEPLDHFRWFVDTTVLNTSVCFLHIGVDGGGDEDTWRYLFNRLRENSSIKSLIFSDGSKLTDENFRDLMDLLQVNFILEKIDLSYTSWYRSGKARLIDEALERNKRQAGYLSVLQRQNLEFKGAKAGRVFLCGSPFAGKTRLKLTMMETMSKKSTSESIRQVPGKVIAKIKAGRTRGIEVELLCDNEDETVSIWDLAGQDIFRALQNLVFPRISQACVFCFVFNPFERKDRKIKDKSRKIRENVHEAFFAELKSWLRFVASVQITGRILPQMLVIVTHKDKLEKCGKESLATLKCIQDCAKVLREKYKDVVELCPTANSTDADFIHHVNAKVEKEVQNIKDVILFRMKNVLKTKSTRVPIACSQLASCILQRRGVVESSPVVHCEDFYRFCSTQNSLLKGFDSTTETGRNVLHAAASYLHDAGVIFMTPSARRGSGDVKQKSVVVDVNWLTQNLLGELASHGHGFETETGPLARWKRDSGPSSPWQTDGFIEPKVLYEGIQKILKKKKGVDIEIVKELLFELDLCYRVKSENEQDKYFMPMIFGPKIGEVSHVLLTNKLSWVVQHSSSRQEHCPSGYHHWSLEEKEHYPSGHHHSSLEQKERSSGQPFHFGFRIQCEDIEKTSFNHGFYPRFQIDLRKHMDALGVLEKNFIFSRYHVKIRINGCIIFVEIDPSGENHVDVLVQFSKQKTRDWAMNYVQENVVKKLLKFSASDEGCPAVQLDVAVLRTQCVELLIPRTLRGENQAVSIEELKRRFKDDIESQLENGEKEEEILFGYMYAWPEVKAAEDCSGCTHPCTGLADGQEPVQRLLSSKEYSDVVVGVQKTHEDLWQNLDEIREVSRRLSDLQETLDRPEGSSGSRSGFQDSSRQREQESESLTPEVPQSKMTYGERVIYDEVVHLRGEMKTGFEQVRSDLRTFKSTWDEMLSRMTDVESKIDAMIGYIRSKEGHRTPNRPYFRFDASFQEKVIGALLFSKPVRLHLMCEARGKAHFVEGQEGLELRIEKGDKFSKSMRTLSVVSMKMIWVLLKIGAQVTAGLGNAVPDLACLASVGIGAGAAAANIALDSVKSEMDKNLDCLEPAKVHEAWCLLRDHLHKNLTRATYASLFKLHLVSYKKTQDPYAWLCTSCVLDGRRNFLLEP